MGCQSTRCKNPDCGIKVPACQLINGYCKGCWTKMQQTNAYKLVTRCLAFF